MTPETAPSVTFTKSPSRVLVLGASGMLGHKLVQRLSALGMAVSGTVRGDSKPSSLAARETLANADILTNVDVLQDADLEAAIEASQPDVIINAVGVIKQIDIAKDAVTSIATNALLPHRIAVIGKKRRARLIQVSTDCVFAGESGPYSEQDPTDAEDLYGRSKLLGEVSGSGCLTIRSSIVGRELRGRSSLIEWFLSQRGGKAKGFAGALYTGLTTSVMADLIGNVITNHSDLDGVWHVASESISKYDLLKLINHYFELGVALERDEKFACDRRLDGSRFRAKTGFVAPSWDQMIADLRSDTTPYDTN